MTRYLALAALLVTLGLDTLGPILAPPLSNNNPDTVVISFQWCMDAACTTPTIPIFTRSEDTFRRWQEYQERQLQPKGWKPSR